MKVYLLAGVVVLLIGCAATDYAKLKPSTASLANVVINETLVLDKGEHKLAVSFDYEIKDFNPTSNLYSCTVQFVNLDKSTMTRTVGSSMPCKLDSPTGHVAITWPSPIDKSTRTSKERLDQIKYPMEYFIAIHQKTGRNNNLVIGSSQKYISGI